MRLAIETLAAAHARTCPPPQASVITSRQRAIQRFLDLAGRHQLAMADDAAISGLRPVTRHLFRDVADRMLWWICNRFDAGAPAFLHAAIEVERMGCDPERGCEPGRADAADGDP